MKLSKDFLEDLYIKGATLVGKTDPIMYPKRFGNNKDIEVTAFIASVFAFGSISQIMKILERISGVIGKKPYNFCKSYSEESSYFLDNNIYYRFYSPSDIEALFFSIRYHLLQYGSLEKYFNSLYRGNENSLYKAVELFCKSFREKAFEYQGKETTGLKFMFPDPAKGSACKRFQLFLRWMVRKDNIDFGIWKVIPKSELLIPVDTHIKKVALRYKLTRMSSVTWTMAQQITDSLKKFSKEDPVRYDFSLCHNEILKKSEKIKN